MYKKIIKRAIDILLSLIGIIVLAIPMLIVAVTIKIDSPGPALFTQRRVGIHKKEFVILKFRSMPVNAPHDMPTHRLGRVRLTGFQRFIRRSSIDELPQIFNIFAGHMSIVGPRPALWNQYDLIAERDRYGANDVKPGLTGWAQINGRDELGISEKARFDGEYVAALNAGHGRGFAMDCKCFVGTVGSVIRHKGVIENGTCDSRDEAAAEKETVGK